MDSNLEWLIESLLNGESVADFTPKSRMEEYLKAILSKSGTNNLPIPRSRIDALLYQLAQSGEIGTLPLQTKTVTPTLEAQTVTADDGYALSKVNVEAATDVYDEGVYAERKAMWDALQHEGTRTEYAEVFNGSRFGDKNFYPIYNMKPTSMRALFSNSNDMRYCGALHLADRLKECNITLDTSDCTNFQYAFLSATNVRGDFGTFDIRKNTTVNGMFTSCAAAADPAKIRLIVDENTNLEGMFSGGSIKWLYIDGTIGKSFNLSSLGLDTECAKLIIETNLKNLIGTDLEGTRSFKLHPNVWAALNADSAAPNGGTWEEYVTDALGWTI